MRGRTPLFCSDRMARLTWADSAGMHLKGTRPLRAIERPPLGGAPLGGVVQAQDLLRRVISGAARTALVAVATRLADSSGGLGRVEAGQAAGSGVGPAGVRFSRRSGGSGRARGRGRGVGGGAWGSRASGGGAPRSPGPPARWWP